MRTVVWAFAGILALDAILVAWLSMVDAVRRRRAAAAAARRDARASITDVEPVAARVLRLPFVAAAERPAPARYRLRRVSFAVGVAALTVLAAAQLRGELAPTTAAWTDRIGGTALAPRVGGSSDTATGSKTSTHPTRERAAGDPFADGVGTGQKPPRKHGESTTVPASIAAEPRSAGRIVIVWTPVPGALEYEVQRRAVSEEWSSIISTDATTFLDTGLEADTTYFYRVLTVTVDGNAGPSDVTSATTPAVPPAAPNLSSSASGTSITLSWTDVDGETGFRIERTVSGTADWVVLATTGEDVLSYEDGGLTAGSSYDYRVFATGEGGDSPSSNVVTMTVVGDSASTSEDEGDVPPPPDGH